MDRTLLIVLGILNIPVYLVLGKLFFDDWEGFGDALKYMLKPNIVSLFHGEYLEDMWSGIKMSAFLIVCGGLVWGEYVLLQKILGG